MIQILLAIAFLGTTILSPIASIKINPLQEFLLNQFPEEKIITFANNINKNDISSEEKIKEIQSIADSQQQKINEQESKIKQLENKAEQDIKKTSEDNRESCDFLHRQNGYCENAEYKTQSAFNKKITNMKNEFEKDAKADGSISNDAKTEQKRELSIEKANFDKCQEIIKKCN